MRRFDFHSEKAEQKLSALEHLCWRIMLMSCDKHDYSCGAKIQQMIQHSFNFLMSKFESNKFPSFVHFFSRLKISSIISYDLQRVRTIYNCQVN